MSMYNIDLMQIHEVDINLLKTAKFQPENRTYQSKISDLEKALINGHQLVYPIIIDNDYNVIDGHRRLYVLTKNGHSKIPCFILSSDQATVFAELNGTNRAMNQKDNQTIFLIEPEALTLKARRNQEKAVEFFGFTFYSQLVNENKHTVYSLMNECRRAQKILRELPKSKQNTLSNIDLAKKILQYGQSIIRGIESDLDLTSLGKARKLQKILNKE